MKLSELLVRRQHLLRQTQLANLAFAYERLGEFADRITRGNLRGPVSLKRAGHEAGHAWPTLTALRCNQSVLDEHFCEEDIIDLTDVIEVALQAREPEIIFDLRELKTLFQEPLRLALEEAGVEVDDRPAMPPLEDASGDLHSSARDDDEI